MTKRNRKGFTLMEMLIVVAIIAILIAVAIPTFSSALSKAKLATDEANFRALKGLIVTEYLTEGKEPAADATGNVYLHQDGSSTTTESAKAMASQSESGTIYYTKGTDGVYTAASITGLDSSVASFKLD